MTAPVELYDADVDRMLAGTADELFADHAGPEKLRELEDGGGRRALVARTGARAGLARGSGGAGRRRWHRGTHRNGSAPAGRHLAQIPLGPPRRRPLGPGRVGLAPPAGPLAVVLADGDETRFKGVAHGRQAHALVVVRNDRLEVVEAFETVHNTNLVGAARHDVVAHDGTEHSCDESVRAGVESRLALARAAATAGALEEVRRLTIAHARTRMQFGIPIARLPVVRERLALVAEQVASAGAAVDVARLASTREPAEIAVAAAKVRSAEAATQVARHAHQLHGAIGVTSEHTLQLYTRRLWAWRDEDGTEQSWSARLGRALANGDAWERIVEEAPV